MRSALCKTTLAAALCLCSNSAAGGPPEDPAPAPISSEPIDLEPTTARDQAIERRIEGIYAELESLTEVEVDVESGVVHLRGQVFERDARDEAEAIAARVDGVVTIENDIAQIRSIARRFRPLVDRLRERGLELWTFTPLLVVGLLLIGASLFGARLLGRVVTRAKPGANVFVRELIGQLVRGAVVVFGVVLAFELMGATTLIGAVLGTAGVVGLALGFAFRDMAENYIASLLLSIRQPFEPDDLVELEGQLGSVVRLTSRATILLTVDGHHVRIPNAAVFKATIINYTRNPQRRFYFEVGVAAEAELAAVQELAIATIQTTPGVLAEPSPSCYVEGFAASAMTISISGWVDQREASWVKVSSEARRRIKLAFEGAGVDVPEPILRVQIAAPIDPEQPADTPRGEPLDASETTCDVSPDHHLVRQVAEQRKQGGDDDLLCPDGPSE